MASSITIGINDFILHRFVPNFVFIEPTHDLDSSRILANNINKRAKDYEHTTILLEASTWRKGWITLMNSINRPLLNSAIMFQKAALPGSLLRIQRFIEVLLLCPINLMFCALPWRRSTVEKALYFAMLCEPKRIILCGIDLKGDYFHCKNINLVPGCIPVSSDNGEMRHPTNDHLYDKITASDIIGIYAKIATTKNVGIYVYSNTSDLYPALSVHEKST